MQIAPREALVVGIVVENRHVLGAADIGRPVWPASPLRVVEPVDLRGGSDAGSASIAGTGRFPR